jgi:hypothetical protein
LAALSKDDDFRVRPGRIRSRAGQRARPFIAQALAAAQRAGGRVTRNGRIVSPRRSMFGRGRSATIRASRLFTSRSRGVVIKARVVRQLKGAAPLTAHLKYLRREGVTRDGVKARMFGLRPTAPIMMPFQAGAATTGITFGSSSHPTTPSSWAI